MAQFKTVVTEKPVDEFVEVAAHRSAGTAVSSTPLMTKQPLWSRNWSVSRR